METWKQERKAVTNENSKKKEVAIEKKAKVPDKNKSKENSRKKEGKKELQKDKNLQQWIRKQYQNGAEIACLCTSVFLLPGTGLLQTKNCIKKWFVSNDFRQQFNQVNLIV